MKLTRIAGAIAGGLVAGAGLTVLLLAQEKKQGKPSELATLERAALRKLGLKTPPPDRLPNPFEQTLIQGGHLLLSALAGAVYGATTDRDAGVVSSGVKFGLGFYVVAHWVVGPLLGVKPPEWKSDAKTIAMHTVNHLVFGVVTAAVTKAITR